jgi:hypothetical protein
MGPSTSIASTRDTPDTRDSPDARDAWESGLHCVLAVLVMLPDPSCVVLSNSGAASGTSDTLNSWLS